MAELTPAQIAQFHEDGYLILPALFSAEEIKRMAAEANDILDLCLNTTLARGEIDCRLDVQLRGGKLNIRKVQPINDLSDYLREVSQDERLVGPLRQLMDNQEPMLMEEKLNYKQLLHQSLDTAAFSVQEYGDVFALHHDWGYYRQQGYPGATLSSAVSIDDSTTKNGPLRVVPGSHKSDWPTLNPDPQSGDGRVSEELFDEAQRVPCLAPAGSVMLFHSKLLHDSCANNSGQPRRIMIYSHYPGNHQAEPDQRNRYGRELAQSQENQYRALVQAGKYQDQFHAANEPQTTGSTL